MPDNAEIAKKLKWTGAIVAFNEDREILEAVQAKGIKESYYPKLDLARRTRVRLA